MIKVYLDWNVISQMKNHNCGPLLKILANKQKFLIPYSTSHIGDIFSSYSNSQEQIIKIDEDLDYISCLTDNLCIFNSKNEIVIEYYDPRELFQQRIDDKDLLNENFLDTLQGYYSENESTRAVGNHLIETLKRLPLNDVFKTSFENEESAKHLERLFPGLKENQTMEGFFKGFLRMFKDLNEGDRYKELRQIVQTGTGIKRDKIFDAPNPYDLIDKSSMTFESQVSNQKKYSPEWFDDITKEYLKLDMFGYQEDRIKIKNGRKQTFKNTTEDAFHTAFASTCNFYITNDIRSYNKARHVYHKLNLNTLVLTVEEFIDYYNNFLTIDEAYLNLNIPLELLKTNDYVESKIEGGIMRQYVVPFYFFNFFNRVIFLQLPEKNETIFLLSKVSPTNNKTTFRFEVINLVSLMNNLLGNDKHNIGEATTTEFEEGIWKGREWELDNVTLRLVEINGYIQLYYDFK